MRSEPQERLEEEAVAVWRIHGLLASAIILAIALLLAYFAGRSIHISLAILLVSAALFWAFFLIFLSPSIRYRRFRYQVYEEEIDILRGVWFIKRTLIPMVKVQHVDTKQGPILRHFGLAKVTIHTAASEHEIPALSVEKADALRDQIALLARIHEEEEKI
ncbi:MAG: PH domain-containing protein [Thermicanus sp.]|nr:PH domain-containing protein [Thermicanus sp.]